MNDFVVFLLDAPSQTVSEIFPLRVNKMFLPFVSFNSSQHAHTHKATLQFSSANLKLSANFPIFQNNVLKK